MTAFPTILYKTPGPHKKPRGGTYKTTGAADKAEFDELLKKGWFPSYEEAAAGKIAGKIIEAAEAFEDAVDEVSAPTRDELEAKAKELGVSFNGRTSDKKLAERIAEALEG
jgi:hypothetical protein